ncbi:hypothetical protein AAC387_Pa09g0476 [Persea americana]
MLRVGEEMKTYDCYITMVDIITNENIHRTPAACRLRYRSYLRDYYMPFTPEEDQQILAQHGRLAYRFLNSLFRAEGRIRPIYLLQDHYDRLIGEEEDQD